jgi:hypothetical protein
MRSGECVRVAGWSGCIVGLQPQLDRLDARQDAAIVEYPLLRCFVAAEHLQRIEGAAGGFVQQVTQ